MSTNLQFAFVQFGQFGIKGDLLPEAMPVPVGNKLVESGSHRDILSDERVTPDWMSDSRNHLVREDSRSVGHKKHPRLSVLLERHVHENSIGTTPHSMKYTLDHNPRPLPDKPSALHATAMLGCLISGIVEADVDARIRSRLNGDKYRLINVTEFAAEATHIGRNPLRNKHVLHTIGGRA